MSEKSSQTGVILILCMCLLIIVIECTRSQSRTWREVDQLSPAARTFYEVSFDTCVDECVKRPYCDVLRYWRLRKKCETVKRSVEKAAGQNSGDDIVEEISNINEYVQDQESLNGSDDSQKVYIEVQRNSISDPPCNCSEGLILKNGTCVIDECPVVNIRNAKVLGNRRTIGSKVKVNCKFMSGDALVSRIATCSSTGNWTNLPTCPDDRAVLVGDWIISVWQNNVTYDTAKVLCTAYDGQLIKVQTHEKHTSMVEHLKSLKGDQTDFWIQGTRQLDNYTYKYEDGTPLPTDSFYWGAKEPNRRYEQYCIRMSSKWNYKWGDHECSNNYGYICEYPNFLS